MAKTSKSYSIDWNLMTYLQYELANCLKYHQDEATKLVVKKYLEERIKEIKESLK